MSFVCGLLQVGQIIRLQVDYTSDLPAVFVWEFWDGSVETTRVPYVTRLLTRGGTVEWRCVIVDEQGRSDTVTGSLAVNAPPVLTAPMQATRIDGVLPYPTTITASAEDPEGLPVSYQWLLNGTDLGVTGPTLVHTVTLPEQTIAVRISDPNGGWSEYGLRLTGTANQPPEVNSITAFIDEVAFATEARKKVGGKLRFIGLSRDPQGLAMTHAWLFDGAALATASVVRQDEYERVSSAEISLDTLSSGVHSVVLTSTDAGGISRTLEMSIRLISNTPPAMSGISIYPALIVAAGTLVTYIPTVSDDTGVATLRLRWLFTSSDPDIPSFYAYSVGADPVQVPTSTRAGTVLSATVTVTDLDNAGTTYALPDVSVI